MERIARREERGAHLWCACATKRLAQMHLIISVVEPIGQNFFEGRADKKMVVFDHNYLGLWHIVTKYLGIFYGRDFIFCAVKKANWGLILVQKCLYLLVLNMKIIERNPRIEEPIAAVFVLELGVNKLIKGAMEEAHFVACLYDAGHKTAAKAKAQKPSGVGVKQIRIEREGFVDAAGREKYQFFDFLGHELIDFECDKSAHAVRHEAKFFVSCLGQNAC
jgi:hypothetical protein